MDFLKQLHETIKYRKMEDEETEPSMLPADGTEEDSAQPMNGMDSGEEEQPIDNTDEQSDQMVKRTVKGARLVYKRPDEAGAFEELWIYRINNVKEDTKLKDAILAGTDIEPDRLSSSDGSQSYEMWTAGNAQMLKITGLPN